MIRNTSSLTYRRAPLACLALFAAAFVGCASPQGVEAWQDSAETYVVEQANYDLNALADAQRRDGHRLFTQIGDDDPTTGRDTVGVFVGRRDIEGQPWLIFLVGEVEQRALESARLVAVTQEGPELAWAVGPTDENATQQYRRHRRVRAGDRSAYTGWPYEGDSFYLRANSPDVRVTERNSAATWRLDLRRDRQ